MSDYIYGKNSVLAVLKADPKRVFKIFVAEGHKPDRRLQEIADLAHAHGVMFQKVPRPKLEGMLQDLRLQDPDIQHQGVIASASAKRLLSLNELLQECQPKLAAGEFPLLLMLDGVTDPRNFGAILRVADAAGVDGVIIPKHQSAGFGPAVSKTASGAEAVVNVAVVTNLSQAMKTLKDKGFWSVGAAAEPKVPKYFEQDYQMPTVLVVGNEGDGLSRLVREACDFLVQIPMLGSVDSLNVSAATAVLVFDIRSRSPKQPLIKV